MRMGREQQKHCCSDPCSPLLMCTSTSMTPDCVRMMVWLGMQEGEDIPRDWTTLFDDSLFKFDTSLIPEAVALYDKLSLKKSPLSLIPPQVGRRE